CPGCDAKLRVADDREGTKVACPRCGKHLIVPASRKVARRNQDDIEDDAPAQRRAGKRLQQSKPTKAPPRNHTVLITAIAGGFGGILLIGGVLFYFARQTTVPSTAPVGPRPIVSPIAVQQPPPQPEPKKVETVAASAKSTSPLLEAELPPLQFGGQNT